MEDYKEWSFGELIAEYMAHGIFFERDCALKDLPWSLQIEVKRIVSVLNAFTGGNYEADSKDGKIKIKDAFSEGFHLRNNLCTNEQLVELRELFPVIDDMFDEFDDDPPRICDFFRYLFAVYQAIYNYVTVFDDLHLNMYTDEFLVYDTFKRKKINTHMVEQGKTIYKAFKILLGDIIAQKISISELIEKYGYPAETDKQLEEYDKKWSHYHGYQYREFIKPNNYIDRFNRALDLR